MEWAILAVVVVTVAVVVALVRRRPSVQRPPLGSLGPMGPMGRLTIPDTAEELLAGGTGFGDLNTRFGDVAGGVFPGPKARAWASGVLYTEGVDADADPRYAADLLRRAEPLLTRPAAEALVRAML